MACCILAAFLYAQFKAMLRRWAMALGLIRVTEGETLQPLVAFARSRDAKARTEPFLEWK
jgi:hypothetical protein